VILTHLFFNPAAQQVNVFLIDEPELSLHVQWQELFVDSIYAANPNVQYILATHSPSIILDKLGKCKDVSDKNGGRRVVQYPSRAVRALAFLKRRYNDIDIFVEDSACHNMYLLLIRRILPSSVKLTSVTQVGNKQKLLEACKLDQLEDGRRKLYIVDGDFDHMLGRLKPKLKYLYRMRAYCVENILLNEIAAISVGIEADTNASEADILSRLDFANWLDELCVALFPLFVCYAIAEELGIGVVTVGYSVFQLGDEGRNGWQISQSKVRRRILELTKEIRQKTEIIHLQAVKTVVRKQLTSLKRCFSSLAKIIYFLLSWLA
jgi:hypothetical protein